MVINSASQFRRVVQTATPLFYIEYDKLSEQEIEDIICLANYYGKKLEAYKTPMLKYNKR